MPCTMVQEVYTSTGQVGDIFVPPSGDKGLHITPLVFDSEFYRQEAVDLDWNRPQGVRISQLQERRVHDGGGERSGYEVDCQTWQMEELGNPVLCEGFSGHPTVGDEQYEVKSPSGILPEWW